MRWLGAALVVAVLFAGTQASAGDPLDITGWRYARKICDEGTGWTVIELDGPLLAVARPDLADLRIIGTDRREIPYKEIVTADVLETIVPVRVFDRFTGERTDSSSLTVDLGPEARLTNELVLDTTSNDFFKRVSLEMSEDLRQWRRLGSDCVYDMGSRGGGSNLTLSYPETAGRYIRITIEELGGPPLEDLDVQSRLRVIAEPPTRVISGRAVVRGTSGNDGWVVLDLGHSGMAVTGLTLDVPSGVFRRPVLVEGSADRRQWSPVARDAVYRYEENVRLTIPLPQARYRFYRLTVFNGADSPVTPQGFSFSVTARRIMFERTTPGDLFILYGNPAVRAPWYDPTRFEVDERDMVTAVMGPETPVVTGEEKVVPKRMASEVKPPAWRFSRELVIGQGVDGFVELTVDLDLLDGAAAGLEDLRLVDDDGYEAAFFVREEGDGKPVRWPFSVGNSGEDDEGTWWVLDLGSRYVPSQFLLLSSREETLAEEIAVEGSNDGRNWWYAGRGEVGRVRTILGTEEQMVVAYPRTCARYLRVTASGGCELTPDAVSGYLPSIVFEAETGQTYRLWYGNPDAGPRSYSPALFADAYAPRWLGMGILGPQIDHVPPPERPRFLRPGDDAGGERQPWMSAAVWAALAVLGLALTVGVVRVFRAIVARREGEERERSG